MKKTVFLFVVLCLMFVLASCGEKNPEEKGLPDVSHTVAVKMDGPDGTKYVTGEIYAFNTFSSLNMKLSRKQYDGNTLYRFEFDPEELVKGGTPIVVEFCEDALFVDGTAYEPADGVEYADIIEWAEGKYNTFGAFE